MARILFLAYRLTPNDSRFIKLKQSFEKEGHDVLAIVPALFPPFHKDVTPVDVPPSVKTGLRFLPRPVASRIQQRALIKAALAFKPEIIFTIDPEALRPAAAIKKICRSSLIYDAHEFHEAEDPTNLARADYVNRTEKKFSHVIDLFITVNASIAHLYETAQPALPKALVVRNVVERLEFEGGYDGRLHHLCDLPKGRNILLYHGNLQPYRGVERLMALSDYLPKNWAIVFLGNGPLSAWIDDNIKKSDLQNVVRKPSVPRHELFEYIRGAKLGAALYDDVGLNQHFSSPNKLWEYPACGVPLMVSALPEMARVIGSGAPGFIIGSDHDPQDIVEAIRSYFQKTKIGEIKKIADVFSAENSWEDEVRPILTRLYQLAQASR